MLKVIHVDPKEKKLISSIEMPAKQTTSVAFGGFNLGTLFVTSAAQGLTEEEKQQLPHSGSVFSIEGLGVRGRPANSYIYTTS